MPGHTGHSGRWARGLATRRASRASWPVGGSYIGAVPATYIPARPEAVPSVRGVSAASPHPLVPLAGLPQLTCLAPPPQASTAPPRPGTKDSPHPQPIARRAGIGGGSDANVRQSQARLLKLQTNRKAAIPPRPARGGERAGRAASVGGAGALGLEGPRLGRLLLSGSVRIRILCGGVRGEFQAGSQWTQKTRFLLKERWPPKYILSVVPAQRLQETPDALPCGLEAKAFSPEDSTLQALSHLRSFAKT